LPVKYQEKLAKAEAVATEIREKGRGKVALGDLAHKSQDDIARMLADYVLKDYVQSATSTNPVPYEAKTLFFESHGAAEDYYGFSAVRDIIRKAGEIVRKEKMAQQQELLTRLPEEFLVWARSKHLNRATKSSVELFLLEKGQVLPKAFVDALHRSCAIRLAQSGKSPH